MSGSYTDYKRDYYHKHKEHINKRTKAYRDAYYQRNKAKILAKLKVKRQLEGGVTLAKLHKLTSTSK